MLNPKYTDVGEYSGENSDDDSRGIRFDDNKEDKANENNEGSVIIYVDQPT